MNTPEALEVIKAIEVLAKLFDETGQKVFNSMCILHRDRLAPLNEAIKLSEEFRKCDIVKRGELLGLNITKIEEGYESTILLSES